MGMDGLRIGVAGCGNQGTVLAKTVLRMDALQLVAGADPDAEALRRLRELAPGISTHHTVEEMLVSSTVDAVLVATPHDVLAPVSLAAIRAGRQVLVEKPLALDAEQAREVEFAAASAGVTCMVGYSFRYGMAHPAQIAHAAGAVGELTAITGSICMPRLDDGWSAVRESGGGPLMYVGCHLVDLVLWLVGDEPSAVSATVTRRDSGVDDTSAIQLEFAGGCPVQLLVTQSAASFRYELCVLGRSGSIVLRGNDFVHYTVEVQSTVLDAYREPTVVAPTDPAGGDPISDMFVPELAEFAAAIAEDRPPAITVSDGRRVLRVLDAVAESARTGRAVAPGAPMLAAY